MPLYDTLGPDAISHIIAQAGLPTVFCGTGAEVVKLCNAKREKASQMAALAHIVCFDATPGDEATAAATGAGVTLHTLDAVVGAGRDNPSPVTPATAADIALLCYT